jgi:hypothetical protein
MQRMSRTFARVLIVLVALTHATFFIIYQSPDWSTSGPIRPATRALGRALAQTGRFRAIRLPAFHPRVLRTPGYPLFVAAVNLTLARDSCRWRRRKPLSSPRGACCRMPDSARGQRPDGVRGGTGDGAVPAAAVRGAHAEEVFTTFVVTLGLYLWLLRCAGHDRTAEPGRAGLGRVDPSSFNICRSPWWPPPAQSRRGT